MDIYKLLTTPIDELYDMGVLQKPEPEQHTKMCTLSFKCCICGDTYTERYQRNNPDKVSRGMYCAMCNTPTMFLEQAVPFTLFYKSSAMEHASFCDDVSTECWYCGSPDNLRSTLLSNEQEIKLCSKHFRGFVKESYTARQRKQKCLQAKEGE